MEETSEWFTILSPDRIPALRVMRAQLGVATLGRVAAYVARGPGLPTAEAATLLLALHDVPSPSDEPLVTPTSRFGKCPMAANDESHDQYFLIRRVGGLAGIAFVRSLLRAGYLFRNEVGNASGDYAAVGGGLHALTAYLAHVPHVPRPCIAHKEPLARRTPAPVIAKYRWLIGHQIFAVLSQGIIFALQEFETAMSERDVAAASAALDLVTELLLASAASFRFTAEFDPEIYRDVIRPSMMPPFMSDGFSGLLSSDHRMMVNVMERVRPMMAEAEIRVAPVHLRMVRALQQVYDDHKFVCARFDGAARPSLRGETCTRMSAVEQLDRFKHARLRLVRTRGKAVAPIVGADPGLPE